MSGFGDRLRDLLASRKFKWAITITFGVLVVLYFAFVTFLFDPFEDDLEDMATIVDREVDYFIRWQGIADRFDGFPTPAVWSEFEGSGLHTKLASGQKLDDWDASYGISDIMRVLEDAQGQVPPGLSLEGDLMREVAVAGKGKIGFDSQFDGMLMLRVSFKVKAGVAFLDFGFVRDQLPASLGIASAGSGRYKLPQFEPFGFQDAYLMRVRDVLLLATSEEWLDAAHSLMISRGEGSLANASVFHDNVTAYLSPDDQPFEAYVRREQLHETVGRFPDPESESYWEKFLNGFFDSDILRYLAGYWRPGDRFEGRFTGEIDVQRASEFQRGWYESSPLEVRKLTQFAQFVPADSFLYGAVSGDPTKVLLQVERSLDEETRRLLDEAIIQSGSYQGSTHLFQEIGSAINPGLYLALRRFEYPPDERDVPNDGSAMPVFCLFATLRNEAKFTEIEDFFRAHYREFVDEGAGVRSSEVKLQGGGTSLSFESVTFPGTGELVISRVPAGKAIVFGNSYRYMEQLMRTYFVDPDDPRAPQLKLSATEGFQDALDGLVRGRGSANLFVYLQPDQADHYFEKLAQDQALERFLEEMRESWGPRRPQIEAEQRERLFPNRVSLTPFEQSQVEEAVENVFRLEDRATEARLMPDYIREKRHSLLPLAAFDWLAVSLKADRKRAELLVGGQLDYEE